jgi:hypothetical protein
MIVNIPLWFEFRKTQVQWVQVSARLVGWARRGDGTVDPDCLIAQYKIGGVLSQRRYSRRRLPEGEWVGLWLQAYRDSDVEQVFADFEPLLFVPSGSTYLKEEDLKQNSQPRDAWQLREEFLKLGTTSEEIVGFLNEWGRWNSEEFIEIPELIRLQQAIREAVTISPGDWFSGPYAVPGDWRRMAEYPFFSLLTDRANVALRMTVTCDLLSQSEFRTCARPDCGQPFKVESKHEKKFCSRSCGHLEAVRRSRRIAVTKVPAL